MNVHTVDTFLTPIEHPRGLMMKLAYFFTRKQFGKVLTPLKVHSARLPAAFGLFYYDTKNFATLSPTELQAIGDQCHPYDKALRATGKLVAQGSLSQPETWRRVQPRNGKPVIANGPYTQENLQVGAFFIVETGSMDEALRVASNHAAANYGENLGFAVEIRECDMFE